jgi:hypothetical protein
MTQTLYAHMNKKKKQKKAETNRANRVAQEVRAPA